MRSFSIGATLFAATLAAGACIPDAVLIGGGGGGGGGTGTGSGTGTATGSGSGTNGGSGTGVVGCDTAEDCPGMDTTCQTRVCENGACDFEVTMDSVPCTENGGQVCDGMGSCVECLVDAHCTEPPCINNTCGIKLDNGEPCTDDGDCTSNNCVDDVCCDLACDGVCESCAAADTCQSDGTCSPIVAGTDPDGECNAMQTCFGGACQQGRIAFVTSGLYDGALGGLSGADQICANHAAMGCLPGTYMAWLSTATENPTTRFTQDNVPWRRVDGTLVSNGFNDLVDGTVSNPINVDELGNMGPLANISGCDPDLAWSGTGPDGIALTMTLSDPPEALGPENRCDEWTSTSANGQWGKFGASTSNWTVYCTGNGTGSCQLATALYCFQQ